MISPFQWIRNMARAAVVNGVADGLQDVTPDELKPIDGLAELQNRLRSAATIPALPAADDRKTERKK